MRLIAIAAMLGLATPVFPQLSGSYPVWYNELYDQGSTPLTSVACSGGLNGVITMGYETFSDLPSNRGVLEITDVESEHGSHASKQCPSKTERVLRLNVDMED